MRKNLNQEKERINIVSIRKNRVGIRRFRPVLFATVLMMSVIVAAGCSSKSNSSGAAGTTNTAQSSAAGNAAGGSGESAADESSTTGKTFTTEELAKYDGTNGNPAYVAIDGVVYDVTNVPQWSGGKHQGLTAGKDLTSELSKSPHGSSVLKQLPVVGTLTK